MVAVCLPSDALWQHLPSYLGFSYPGNGVSLHGCSSKAQPLLLTLDKGCLLMAAPPDLDRGVAPLGPPAPCSRPAWTWGFSSQAGPLTPRWGSSSRLPPPLISDVGKLLSPPLRCRGLALLIAHPDLGWGVAPRCHASTLFIAAGSPLILRLKST